MSPHADIVVHTGPLRALLKSAPVADQLQRAADTVAGRAQTNLAATNPHDRDAWSRGAFARVENHRVAAVARIGTTHPGAAHVEAHHGVLARSLGPL